MTSENETFPTEYEIYREQLAHSAAEMMRLTISEEGLDAAAEVHGLDDFWESEKNREFWEMERDRATEGLMSLMYDFQSRFDMHVMMGWLASWVVRVDREIFPPNPKA